MKRIHAIFWSMGILVLSPFSASPVLAVTQQQISSTVRILCPASNGDWYSGSGTIVGGRGVVLTNRHVVTDANGTTIQYCVVGFFGSIDAEPSFRTNGRLNVAEVKYHTDTDDLDGAILYLVDTTKKYPYIDIWSSNSSLLQFGDKIEVLGFPSIGGSTVTFSSGDFSGFGSKSDGTQNYIKTTAFLEHGNSGGSAYISGGGFVGVPTMVVTGQLGSLSYVLSVNSIKRWLTSLLGSGFEAQIGTEKVTPPSQEPTIQSDTNPPYQRKAGLLVAGWDADGKQVNGYKLTGDQKSSGAIDSYKKLQFSWHANCAKEYPIPYDPWVLDSCIRDDAGKIKGYYYYFGENPKSIPTKDGKYIDSEKTEYDATVGQWHFSSKESPQIFPMTLPEVFKVTEGKKYYFILQAQDDSNNVSPVLMNFEYTYEPPYYLDIKDFRTYSTDNKFLGQLVYPLSKEILAIENSASLPDSDRSWHEYSYIDIYTNQKNSILVPDFKMPVDGFSYLVTPSNNPLDLDSVRVGQYATNNQIVVKDLDKLQNVNIYLKPFKQFEPNFSARHLLLQLRYNPNISTKFLEESQIPNGYGRIRFISSQGHPGGNLQPAPGINSTLVGKLLGYILLQVESHGEAWFVNPVDRLKYYMKDGLTAYSMMRSFGLGITDIDLEKIPIADTANEILTLPSICSNNITTSRLKGRILLQVQQHGEAWYIYPKNCRRIYLKDGETAYQVMRILSLGITNENLDKVPTGTLN